MIEQLSIAKGYQASIYFLEALLAGKPSMLGTDETDQLCMLLGTLTNDAASYEDWLHIAAQVFDMPTIDPSLKVSTKSLLKVLCQFCYLYHDQFGYSLPTLVTLLQDLQHTGSPNPEVWKSWCRSIELASLESPSI